MANEHGESDDRCARREWHKDEAEAHDRQAHGDRTPNAEELGDAFGEHSPEESGNTARCDHQANCLWSESKAVGHKEQVRGAEESKVETNHEG